MPVTWTSPGNCSTARPGSGHANRPDATTSGGTWARVMNRGGGHRTGIFRDTARASWIFRDWQRASAVCWARHRRGGSSRPRPNAPTGLLSVAEACAASPVVEEHEEHDQVHDHGDGQVDGQPLLPLAAVSGFGLSQCPPPSLVLDPFTLTTYERLRESWKPAQSWL